MFRKPKILLSAALVLVLTVFLCSSLFSAVMGDDEVKTPKSNKAWLGIYMQDLDDDIVEAFDLNTDKGVLINGIIDGSPAEKAGLKEGDVIVAFDKDQIDDIDDLRDVMRTKKPGDDVNVVVYRDKDKEKFAVVLTEPQDKDYSYSTVIGKPKGKTYDKTYNYYMKKSDQGYLGIFMQDLNDQLGQYFEVNKGVLISKVEEDSPAEEAGLKAGDVIVSVNGNEVSSSGDISAIISDHKKGDKIDIGVVRKGAKKSFTAVLDEREMDVHWYGLSPDNNGYKFYSGDDFNVPNFEFEFDPEDFDFQLEGLNEDLRQEMKDLREELKELKEELNDLKSELK